MNDSMRNADDYEKRMKKIHRLARRGEYARITRKMLKKDGFRLKKKFRHDLKPERMAARFNLANAFFDQNKFDLAPVEYMQVAACNENALASKANEMIMITRQEMLAQ